MPGQPTISPRLWSHLILLASWVLQTPAQDLSDLPACGQTCITNAIGQASALGCSSSTDIVCLCANADFGYGIRDCADEACDAANAQDVIQYALNLCAAGKRYPGSLIVNYQLTPSCTSSAGGSSSASRLSSTNLGGGSGSAVSSAASGASSAVGTGEAGSVTSNARITTYTNIPVTFIVPVTESGNVLQSTSTTAQAITDPRQYSSLLQSRSLAQASASASSSPPSGGGLSTGAKAGIGVAVVVGGLIAVVAAAFFILKRRKRSTNRADYGKPQLHGKALSRTHGRGELEEGRPVAELDSNTSPRELPGDQVVVGELSAGSTTDDKGTSTTMTDEKMHGTTA